MPTSRRATKIRLVCGRAAVLRPLVKGHQVVHQDHLTDVGESSVRRRFVERDPMLRGGICITAKMASASALFVEVVYRDSKCDLNSPAVVHSILLPWNAYAGEASKSVCRISIGRRADVSLVNDVGPWITSSDCCVQRISASNITSVKRHGSTVGSQSRIKEMRPFKPIWHITFLNIHNTRGTHRTIYL